MKDYGFMLRTDPAYADKAARVSSLARDISEYLAGLGIKSATPRQLTVAYHSACSLQHGQRVHRAPRDLLAACGFAVKEIPEAHLCCGSAGTYNILQPEIAGRLRDRKIANIATTDPDIIAAGNIGCITQIASGTAVPVLHPVELIDWATGGPVPEQLKGRVGELGGHHGEEAQGEEESREIQEARRAGAQEISGAKTGPQGARRKRLRRSAARPRPSCRRAPPRRMRRGR